MPTFALASSQVTLAGMFLGAGRIDLIRKTMVYTMLWGQVLAVSFAFVFYFFATPLCAIFTSDQQIIAVAVSYIRVIALAFPFITVGLISGRVTGTGQRPPRPGAHRPAGDGDLRAAGLPFYAPAGLRTDVGVGGICVRWADLLVGGDGVDSAAVAAAGGGTHD